MTAAGDDDDVPLNWGADTLAIADVAATAARAGRAVAEIPYAIRVLVENLKRHRRAGPPGVVGSDDVAAAVLWDRNRNRGLPLHVERVILPDSSGLPVLLDLAALRDAVAARGGDPHQVEPVVPVDLVVDHSLQVDWAGASDAMAANMRREYERNGERYRFLKWADGAFKSLRVFPPGTGIIHQVNLEFIAEVVRRRSHGGTLWAVPDFVIGGDSHTPMVNGIGVLGWGVGGIDAESAMLGAAYVLPCPEVVGVRLDGTRRAGVTTTDIALAVTERLRRETVVAAIVEYYGDAVDALAIPERATMANMAPEYGATAGFFPIDARTIDYLALTRPGRDLAGLVDAYARRNSLFRHPDAPVPHYQRTIEIDVGAIGAAVAGPRRPQDRLDLAAVAADFSQRLARPLAAGGFAAKPAAPTAAPAADRPDNGTIDDGTIVIAAVTSCTNTSNPAVMLAAGLVAKKARARGLTVAPHVKTSLAPGSRVVTRYLDHAGLLGDLEALGFHVVGYGCTTCGGKSGPLASDIAQAIERDGPVAVAVLSGNRNFEGRIHRLVRANYIMSPPLVVAYALAGRIDRDLSREPVGHDGDGAPVMLADLWPSADEIAAVMPHALDSALFAEVYGHASADPLWDGLAAPTGERYLWDAASTYLVKPPFFDDTPAPLADRIDGARVLGLFGDSLTTDHISPGGEIPADSPAGLYLQGQGIAPRDFNTYVARRCNHHVMARATFANLRIKNRLLPDREGWFTIHHPSGETVTFHEAARRYLDAGTPTIVLAGREYGTGSSRDWAAKGSALLGLRAVIAESYERIHRANLIGMGIVPLAFRDGEGWAKLGLTGRETCTIENLRAGVRTSAPITVTTRDGDRTITFAVTAQVFTESERRQIEGGGILAMMVRDLSAAPQRATTP